MITKAQLLKRRDYLGASDTSCIYNVNPFMNQYELWASKIYKLADVNKSPSTDEGNLLEPAIVKWVSKKLGLKTDVRKKSLEFISEKHPLFICHVDGNVLNYPTVIEAKFDGNGDEWGYSGGSEQTDIPGRVFIQTQHQLLCTGFKYVIVAVWIVSYHGWDKRYFRINRDEERIDKLIQIGTKWWERYVLPARDSDNPEQFAPKAKPLKNLDIFKAIERIPYKVNPITPEVYLEWSDAKRHKKEAEAREKLAKENLMKQMGDARAGKLPDGRIFEYKNERGRMSVDYDKMQQKYPKVYKETVKQGERNVIREIKVK